MGRFVYHSESSRYSQQEIVYDWHCLNTLEDTKTQILQRLVALENCFSKIKSVQRFTEALGDKQGMKAFLRLTLVMEV